MKFKQLLLINVALLSQVQSAFSCTTFSTLDASGNRIVYKGLDRTLGHGHVLLNKRNVNKSALPLIAMQFAQMGFKVTPHAWTSEHASITFNQGGISFPYGGINEKKLSVEVLSLALDTTYPRPNNEGAADFSKPVISETEWTQYILDTSKDLTEAINQANQVQVQAIAKGLHYMVCDNSSQCAVFEYINGKLVITKFEKNETPVLSNTPIAIQKELATLMKADLKSFKKALAKIPNATQSLNLVDGKKVVVRGVKNEKGETVLLTDEEIKQEDFVDAELIKNGVNERIIKALRDEDERRPLLAQFMLGNKNEFNLVKYNKINEAVKLWDTRWNIGYSLDENKIYFRRYLNEDASLNLNSTVIDISDISEKFKNELDCTSENITPIGFNMDELSALKTPTPEMKTISFQTSVEDSKKVLRGEKFPDQQVEQVGGLLLMNYMKGYSCKQ